MIQQFNSGNLMSIAILMALPFIGGILIGIDRKLTALMQSRIGPPITQPFSDVLKLWGKTTLIVNQFQPILAFGYLGFAFTAAGLLVFKQDLLMVMFVTALADLCLVVAALIVKSPYSNLGARRELLSMLSYEPVIFLVYVTICLVTGSFNVAAVLDYGTPLLKVLPAALVALEAVLIVEMKKSPFDVSGSGHAHQELVRGVFTELSGYTLALVELGHWIKIVSMLIVVSLFWATNPIVGITLALLLFLVALIIDNVYPRLTWQRMIKTTWFIGFTLLGANLIALSFRGVI